MKQKRWPTNAENYRVESIAKARRIRFELREAMNALRSVANPNLSAVDALRRAADAALKIAEAFALAAEIESLLEQAKDGSRDNGSG